MINIEYSLYRLKNSNLNKKLLLLTVYLERWTTRIVTRAATTRSTGRPTHSRTIAICPRACITSSPDLLSSPMTCRTLRSITTAFPVGHRSSSLLTPRNEWPSRTTRLRPQANTRPRARIVRLTARRVKNTEPSTSRSFPRCQWSRRNLQTISSSRCRRSNSSRQRVHRCSDQVEGSNLGGSLVQGTAKDSSSDKKVTNLTRRTKRAIRMPRPTSRKLRE